MESGAPPVPESEMTPAERRAARKAAAPPSLDLTMQLRDIFSGSLAGVTAARQAEQVCDIVEAKADVLATDLEDGGAGDTVLMFAVQHAANPEILTRLLKAKADPLASNTQGFTVLHKFASRRSDAASPEMLRILLSAGEDAMPAAISLVQLQSNNGLTPLHVAAAWRDATMCALLVGARASIIARESSGLTPLEWAASKQRANSDEISALEAVLHSRN